jgi:2-polyprenyl-3-methyl-5-hydroxy-6-metoxy-1,4-benzoquinol methylase
MTEIFFEVQEFSATKNVSTEQMIENLHANMKRTLPVLRLRRACVVGGGPSLNDHIEDVKRDYADGFTMIAMNGSARWLIGKGIVPDIHVFYDARAENVDFITETPAKLYLVASHASPAVLDALAGRNVMLFHAHAAGPLLDAILGSYAGSHVLGGAITVGLLMLNMLIVMGFRAAHFYGYDSSNAEDTKTWNASGHGHHAYSQPLNDDRPVKVFKFRDKEYVADPAMAMQAREFATMAANYERMGLKINVIGSGLLPDMWRAYKEAPKPATLEDREAAKYTAIWRRHEYRRRSPGDDNLPFFIQECGIAPGVGVIDFGCGPGRATAKLQEMGCVVLGIDHAANCLDNTANIPFCKANLWNLPEIPPADWGFCCDVMEHIPPEKVDEVLAGIAFRVKSGAFFTIDFHEEFFGERTGGEALHLTVKPKEWWLECLKGYFVSVEYAGGTETNGAFICRHTVEKRIAA